MMMNLFSIFDPISSVFGISMNWIILVIWVCFIPKMYWYMPSRIFVLKGWFNSKMYKEFMILLDNTYKSWSSLIFISVFWFIFFSNSLGLFPYIFTSTSHLMITFSVAFPLWLSFMLFGWINKTMSMFSHLVPLGTPSLLMSFMVIIESISNLIRPGTLAIRLSANMISGHLLLSLLGNQGVFLSSFFLIMLLIMQFFLLILESAVALIQSYVFVVLSSLYSSEMS